MQLDRIARRSRSRPAPVGTRCCSARRGFAPAVDARRRTRSRPTARRHATTSTPTRASKAARACVAHGVVSAMSTVIRAARAAVRRARRVLGRARAPSTTTTSLFIRSVANLLGASFAAKRGRGRAAPARARGPARDRRRSDGLLALEHRRPARSSWSPEMEAGVRPRARDVRRARSKRSSSASIPTTASDASCDSLEERTAAGQDFSFEHRVAASPTGASAGSRVAARRCGTPTARSPAGSVSGSTSPSSKQTEQELRDYEYETRLAFSAGHMGSWRWNARESRGTWSPGARGSRRRPARAATTERWDVVHRADPRSRTARACATRSSTRPTRGDEFVVDYRIRRPDGVDPLGRDPRPRARRVATGSASASTSPTSASAEEALREANDRLAGDGRAPRHAARERAARLRVLRPRDSASSV